MIIRRGTNDSLVCFSADSTLIGPTKEKISLWPFIFIASRLCHISETIGPTKIVHLSKFTGFHGEINQRLFKMIFWSNKYHNNKGKIGLEIFYFFPPTYSNVWTPDSKNKIGIRGFFFILPSPRLFKKASRLIRGPVNLLYLAVHYPQVNRVAQSRTTLY